MLMPFGAHRGQDLSGVPDKYVEWLRTIELYEPLKGEVEEEFYRRRKIAFYRFRIEAPRDRISFAAVTVKVPLDDRLLAKKIVDEGRLALARKLRTDTAAVARIAELAALVSDQLGVGQ